MTPKEDRFVKEYLIDLNATRAARRAGYSARSARSIGPRLLKRPAVQAALAEARAAHARRTQVSAERVLKELARIAFASSDDFLDWGPQGVTLRDKTLLDADQHAAIAEISQNGKALRLKLHDKMAALDRLVRHLDLFADMRPGDAANPDYARLTDAERVQRVLALFERVRKAEEAEAEGGGG